MLLWGRTQGRSDDAHDADSRFGIFMERNDERRTGAGAFQRFDEILAREIARARVLLEADPQVQKAVEVMPDARKMTEKNLAMN